MEWFERYERAAARYAAGESRDLDERQLVQLANAAWAAGLCLLMDGDKAGAREWLVRAAERYRESWDPVTSAESWGRPIAAMKALLIADNACDNLSLASFRADNACDKLSQAAFWALDMGAVEAESPIGRYAGTLALLVLGRDDEAAAVAATLEPPFPADVSAALRALAARDDDAFAAAVADVRRSYENREGYLEDLPVPDTALALEALDRRRRVER
jgi:hypothetical protein